MKTYTVELTEEEIKQILMRITVVKTGHFAIHSIIEKLVKAMDDR